MSRGVDGHWWCVAVLCDSCGVQRAALCCALWFQVERSWRLSADSGKGCVWRRRGLHAMICTIIHYAYILVPNFCMLYMYMTVCMWKKDICQSRSIVRCQCVCVCVRVYLQHLACWVQEAELWRMSCAYTHSPWNPRRDNKLAHTHTLKSPLTLLFIAVLSE